MSILRELKLLLEAIGLFVETGAYTTVAPDEYAVLTPLADVYHGHADDRPQYEMQYAQISLFSTGNYLERKNQILAALLDGEFSVTSRNFLGREDETGYFHYAVDTAKSYNLEDK